MKKVLFLTGIICLLATSCSTNTDVYDEKAVEELTGKANDFNFSTEQTVNLSVDYSAYQTYGPVFFSVYSDNPFEGSEENMRLKEGVQPIFSNYTNADHRYSETITLPAYAKKLYVVSGNFLIAQTMMEAEVVNGRATATAVNYATRSAAASRTNRSMKKVGTATTSLDKLYMLSYKVDVNTGDKGEEQVVKEWHTPLGSWDSESGRPNYILNPSDTDPKLVLTEDEKDELYQAVANALVSHQPCNSLYRKQGDLTLDKESEVSITFLGSSTCWNNTLGYYYYTDENRPTSLMDLNVIMLFPNTQDGAWSRDYCKNPDFYGNIALNRGDAVLLKYYPNIANGDYSGATTKFPKGTKIGFILKSNGWGMQKPEGDKKYHNSYKGDGIYKGNTPIARQYNIWGSSTNGLTYYCDEMADGDKGVFTQPNAERESRVAKFAYSNDNGDEYAIISFEDACNDVDFDDLIFALKPVNAFSDLPKVENKKNTVSSVYAFEDLWPSKGDYDLNDVVVELRDTKFFTKKSNEKEYKITKQTFELTTYLNYVTLTSGLGLVLETNANPSSIVMKKVAPKSTDTVEVAFTYEKNGNVYLLTEDVKGELHSTYILELNYSGIKEDSKTATVKPFIFRSEENDKRWEVHIPLEAPTAKVNTSYFGKDDDCSKPAENIYYVRNSDYPFAFCLTGVSIDRFQDTILKSSNERKPISELYPLFLEWSTSNGAKNADWYLKPLGWDQ